MTAGTDTARAVVASTSPEFRRSAVASRRRVALLGVFLLAGAFYFWTATSSHDPIAFGVTEGDYYNQLTNGFLRGELSIPTLAPAGAAHLADPYNPAVNGFLQQDFHDLSLYHGHFYLSWGPAPVLTLFLPWRVLHVGQLDPVLAALIYLLVALACLLLLLDLIVGQFLSEVSIPEVVLAALALSCGDLAPYLLRRVAVYEVALSAGLCFAALGVYLLARAVLLPRHRRACSVLASLAFGLAAASREDLVVLVALPGAVALARARRARGLGLRARFGPALALLGPFGVVAALLLWYNAARFGDPLQFGASYQLAGFDPTKLHYYRPGYLPANLYYYLLAPLRYTLAFPYLALPPPPGYPGVTLPGATPEIVGGILTTTPIVLVLFVGPFLPRLRTMRPLGGGLAVLAGVGLLTVAVVSFSVPGATMRYEADFAPWLVVAALCCWLAWRPPRRWARRAVRIVATLLIAYGLLGAVAVSITGPEDELQSANPTAFHALEDLSSPLPTLFTMIVGHPDITRVLSPGLSYPADLGDYGTYRPSAGYFDLGAAATEVDIVSPRAERAEFVAFTIPLSGARRVTVDVRIGGARHTFRAGLGDHAVDVVLRRGLNRLYLSASARHAARAGDPVSVSGLSIGEASR